MAPTMAPLPAHSCASVKCVLASRLVAMKRQPGFSEMHSVAVFVALIQMEATHQEHELHHRTDAPVFCGNSGACQSPQLLLPPAGT